LTRIDFYILEDKGLDAAYRFACRLSLRALDNAMPVHIQVADSEEAETLDAMMWDYPRHRMLPHRVLGVETPGSGDAPIHIAFGEPIHETGLLINLAPKIADFFGRFDRLAEILVEDTKVLGREHYKFYRDRGYPLHHHDIKHWDT
tara:strand:+ start:662 stop:1099 length:438 start_codon:yes stop_codon:yes gene_type:complete